MDIKTDAAATRLLILHHSHKINRAPSRGRAMGNEKYFIARPDTNWVQKIAAGILGLKKILGGRRMLQCKTLLYFCIRPAMNLDK
ncbi:MAG: hypothetical protein HY204_05200 [Nitrospirae bacterium]|nr:hypothetical protein [Nitrospirota bacterium]